MSAAVPVGARSRALGAPFAPKLWVVRAPKFVTPLAVWNAKALLNA